jgi:hypothetical protein
MTHKAKVAGIKETKKSAKLNIRHNKLIFYGKWQKKWHYILKKPLKAFICQFNKESGKLHFQ